MIASLLAAAAVLSQTGAGMTPQEIGRASVMAGMCSTLGWESSQDRAMQLGQAYVVDNGLDDEATAAEMNAGVAAANAEIRGLMQALESTGDAVAFRSGLRSRCEETARRLPRLMNRTAQTDAVFEAKVDELLAGRGG